jgi:hypothetical protein
MSPWSTLRVTVTVFLLLSAPVFTLEGQETTSDSSSTDYEPEPSTIDMPFGFNASPATNEAVAPKHHVIRPPEVQLDVEGYPLAPDGLVLEQVHVYVRHGERAPTNARLSRGPAPIPEHWMLCKNAQRFRDIIRGLNDGGNGLASRNIVVERADGSPAEGEWYAYKLRSIPFLVLLIYVSQFFRRADRHWTAGEQD